MSGPLNPALEGNPVSGYLKFAVPSIVALLAITAREIIASIAAIFLFLKFKPSKI